MLSRKKYIENISDKLSWFNSKVKLSNSINLYDLNIHAETFFCKLLNMIFNFDLINLNHYGKNYCSIDLGDEVNKVAVQVTSDNSSTKIHSTIDGFISKKYYEKYERLIILILGDKKNYTTTFDTRKKFIFSKKDDIFDMRDLMNKVESKETGELEEISRYLDEEIINPSTQTTTSEKDIIIQMKQRAAALCRVKLKASGISEEISSQIATQDIDSSKFDYIISAAEQGKNFLVGEFGSGKSHAILILAQRYFRDYLSGKYNRMPLFFQAYEILEFKSIQKCIKQLDVCGNYIIFIDGLDEIEYSAAKKIISEIIFLKELWGDSLFIIGTRPMSIIPENNVCIPIRILSSQERSLLFATVSGVDQSNAERAFQYLDSNFVDLLSRPFFCIIFAIFKAEPRSWVKTDMDLVSIFINKSVEKLKNDSKEILYQLECLAVIAVNKNLGRIHRSEIDIEINIESVLKTGFLTLSGSDYFSFPLPIVAQWLASEAIRHKIVLVKDILSNEDSISRWRFTLSILFSQISFKESQNFFSAILQKTPGIAASIIRDGIRFGSAEEFPPVYECGQMLRFCMNTWIKALGPLSDYIAPIGKNGLYNLAIYIDSSMLSITWADRPKEDPIVVMPLAEQGSWFSVTNSRYIPVQATWPWIVTFEYLADRLEKVVKSHSILIKGGIIESEYVWNTTRILANKGSLYDKQIDITTVDDNRKYIGNGLIHNGHNIQCDLYFSIIDRLLSQGIDAIEPPFPVGDKSISAGNFIWSRYSNQRMLELVKHIYSNGINEYKQLVESVFIKISSRMPIFSLYPVEFTGYLSYNDNRKDITGNPKMTWFFSALPYGQKTKCTITLGNENQRENRRKIVELHQNNIRYRPTKQKWVGSSIHQEILHCNVPSPVTDVVYDWLKDDLKAIGWIK